MKKNFYQTTILIIFIGTLFIGGSYLLSDRTPEQNIEETSQPPTLPGLLPILTPVPTSTPILPPLQSTIPGDIYYFYGDWESAIASYQATLDTDSSPDQISAALLGLGKVYFQKQNYQQAHEIGICTISIGELLSGFKAGNKENENRKELEEFLDAPRVKIHLINEVTAEFYAELLNSLNPIFV